MTICYKWDFTVSIIRKTGGNIRRTVLSHWDARIRTHISTWGWHWRNEERN